MDKVGKVWAMITLIWSPICIATLLLDWFGLIRGGIFFRNPFLFWINDTFLLVFYFILALISIAASIITILEREPPKRDRIRVMK